jgi:MFS transporter, DHA1 family, tetracycline resistance protein
MPDKKVSIFPILLVNFIGTLGFSIVLPFLVFLVTKFGGNALTYGVMGAVYPAFQLIGAPILGKWSDIYGRKKILQLSQAGTLAGWIIFFIAFFVPMKILLESGVIIVTLPLLVLFAARAIDGLTGGNISVANAYLADITTEKERSKNFGRLAVSANLGFIAGPALAGILGSTSMGEKPPVVAAIIISLAAFLVILFLLPDSKPRIYKDDHQRGGVQKVLGYEHKECFEAENKVSFKSVLRLKNVPYFLLMNFLIFLGFNFFYTSFPVHVVQKLGWSLTEMGIFYSVLSLVMAVVEGPVLSFASKKFSESTLILFGCFVLGINFILLISTNMAVLYLASVLFAFGNGLMWPSFLSVLSKATPSKYQGSVQGFTSSSGSLASIFGLVLGGILYAATGAMTFIIAASVIFIVFLLSFRLRKFDFANGTGVKEQSKAAVC